MTTMTMEPGRDEAISTSSLGHGEILVASKFLDERITVGKEYVVRAIGQNKYAEFVGSLELIRAGYGWSLTFDEVRHISSDGSLAPDEEPGLATVFPKEASFTIYADSAPEGYGLQDV